MNLSEIKIAEIKENAFDRVSKFIIAEISDGYKSISVLRSTGQEFHKDILQTLSFEVGKGLDITVKGGGKLFVDTKAKKIWIWGESTAYGAPDYNEAKRMLRSAYKNFDIFVKEYSL